MNWGHKIAITYSLFVGLIVLMVVGAFQQNIDLVSQDYYQEELDFQDRLNQSQNVINFDQQLVLEQRTHIAELKFVKAPVSGQIQIYRPSEASDDQWLTIKKNVPIQTLDLSALNTGLYKLKVSWEDGERNYFQELNLLVP